MRPLLGITLVTLEHAIARPFATPQLADRKARAAACRAGGLT